MLKKNDAKFIIFSDIHYAPVALDIKVDGVQRKLTEYAVPLANKLIETVNETMPDAVINLGDSIQDSSNYEEDINNLKYICNVFKGFNVPFLSVSGNHDLRLLSRQEVSDIMGQNHHNFSEDIKGYHIMFLGLDVNEAAPNGSGGILRTRKLRSSTLEWIKNDLLNNNLPTLIFIHYGVAEDDMQNNFWFYKNKEAALLENRVELKHILENDNNVLAVFSGHQHWTKRLVEGNIQYFVVGSLTENMKNDGVPDGIYLEVDIKNKDIEVKEHHLKI
ncbi:MAG: metallophosphoesterase [Spirochaetales bacterium]